MGSERPTEGHPGGRHRVGAALLRVALALWEDSDRGEKHRKLAGYGCVSGQLGGVARGLFTYW